MTIYSHFTENNNWLMYFPKQRYNTSIVLCKFAKPWILATSKHKKFYLGWRRFYFLERSFELVKALYAASGDGKTTYSEFKAPSTLIRFQTKTELFCSVFKKICVHTYRFRIVFARPHYNDHQERSHMEPTVRHFGDSRSTGLAPGHV